MDTLPLSVLVAPYSIQVVSHVLHATSGLSVAVLRGQVPLSDVDPRAIVDLVVMDVAMAQAQAPSHLEDMRSRWPSSLAICMNVPSEATASHLLDCGADIALCGDISATFARSVLRAAARRMHWAHAKQRMSFGDLVLDRDERRVWCAGSTVALTAREFQLLEHLFLNAGRIVSHRELSASAWRTDPTITSNGLAVYVGYLRRKLARSQSIRLVTIRGRGYSLTRSAQATRPQHVMEVSHSG
jgi:DNA-binding response OmpR family regulator